MSRSRLGWLVGAALVAAALGACRGVHGHREPVNQSPIAERTATEDAAAMHTHTHADGTTHTHSHHVVDAEEQAGHGKHVDAGAPEQLTIGSVHPEHNPNAPCTCASDMYHNTWCRSCDMGFIAGVPMSYAILFDTIDPHGHEVNPAMITCATCRSNISSNGFCEPCSMGFYKKQAYFTKLTHGIAQGIAVDPAVMKCSTCKSHVGETGWCETCNKGIVGNVAISDHDVYQTTAPEFDVLLAAIEKADTCEECACAMVMHRKCPKCQIDYAGIVPAAQSP